MSPLRGGEAAEEVINARRHADPAALITEMTRGGARISIDALGSAVTAVNSVGCLRRRGRHIQVGLLLGGESRPPIPMDLVISRELEIYGSHGLAARDYPAMLALIAERQLPLDRLIARQITLDDAPEALATLDREGLEPGMIVIGLP